MLHQSEPPLLPAGSRVTALCCDAAIPGIPPPGTHKQDPTESERDGNKKKKGNIPETSFNKNGRAAFDTRSEKNATVDVCVRVHVSAALFPIRQRAEMTRLAVSRDNKCAAKPLTSSLNKVIF